MTETVQALQGDGSDINYRAESGDGASKPRPIRGQVRLGIATEVATYRGQTLTLGEYRKMAGAA